MAIGLGRIFGIRLPANFCSPYKADSIIEFWRRWHMPLSQFCVTIYNIPLGGNRKGKPRRYINLMITMLLGGVAWRKLDFCFMGRGTRSISVY
jgi:alginate O-acetyltransferase complex protein AlgI